MPIYEYTCEDCSGRFEELVPSADRDAVTCPSCHSRRVTRAMSVFAPGQSTRPAAGGPVPDSCRGCGQFGACSAGGF